MLPSPYWHLTSEAERRGAVCRVRSSMWLDGIRRTDDDSIHLLNRFWLEGIEKFEQPVLSLGECLGNGFDLTGLIEAMRSNGCLRRPMAIQQHIITIR